MADMNLEEMKARHGQLDAAARALLADLDGLLPADEIEESLEDIDAGEPVIAIAFLLEFAIERSVKAPPTRIGALQELRLPDVAQEPLERMIAS